MESKEVVILHETKQENVTIEGNNNNNGTHNLADGDVINLDHGDPIMFYPYWKNIDNECSVTIKASDMISYFVNPKDADLFYQRPEFNDAVRRMHRVVGNAVTDGRYIIGGTGSSQLFITALRALAFTVKESTACNNKKHIPVVCAEPYYSFYKEAMEQERSELYKWQGDANTFKEELGPYIEVVTSPNNPDGQTRKPVVNREEGLLIYDLACYWPHYTPITSPADYDIMLFTLSKTTGHAGSRIGWAIVKDQEIAKKMKKQILLMSIGSCHEGQLRAAKLLHFVRYEHAAFYEHEKPPMKPKLFEIEGLFDYGHRTLAQRWEKLRAAIQHTGTINLPDFSLGFYNFFRKLTQLTPTFAWLECKTGEDAEILTQKLRIRARNGSRFGFGVSGKYIRVSMMGVITALTSS